MKPSSELVDAERTFEVVVAAAYRVKAPSESEAVSRAKDRVSSNAWSSVTVSSSVLVDENRPPTLPKGMDRWRAAFDRLEVGRRVRQGPVALTIDDERKTCWWSNGELVLRAEEPLDIDRHVPELGEAGRGERVLVTFGPAFREETWRFPSWKRSDTQRKLTAADVYLELVESSVPGVRWFASVYPRGYPGTGPEGERVEHVLVAVAPDDTVVAFLAPCHYAEPPK